MEHRLDWKDGKLWKGDVCLGSCVTDACRELLDQGLAKSSDRIMTYRGKMACLGASVGWMAEREVTTSNEGTPIFRKLRKGKGAKNGAEA